ncbi:hypothetical protein RintRC_0560 [Richelia intracellularis]|nr:hypothetical protein RintRC_0560 [Richelia intracellularis]
MMFAPNTTSLRSQLQKSAIAIRAEITRASVRALVAKAP